MAPEGAGTTGPISEGEVAVYDRQLRLWGVQAQQRLLQAKVLVWGLEGSNVELCKNLVLAGVSLTVRDHRKVTQADVNFNYFLRASDLTAAASRAEAAVPRIQEMNPLNSVKADSEAAAAADAKAASSVALVKGYDVVCVSMGVLGWDVERAVALDTACREVGACFFLTLSAGELAFVFSDLGAEHTVREKSGPQGGAGSTAPLPEEKKEEGTEGSAQGGAPKSQAETVSFPSLKEWLEAAPRQAAEGDKKGRRQVDASFLVVALLLDWLLHAKGSAALGGSTAQDSTAAASFEAHVRAKSPEAGIPSVDGFTELRHLFSCFFVEPLVHVASVLGGLLAQEVIKAITQRDLPLVNSICFNAHTNAALVERIPAPEPKAAGMKRKSPDEPSEQVEEL